jgi:hypothetical protein
VAPRLTNATVDRRSCARTPSAAFGVAPTATMRPGREITLVNVASRGLLIRSRARVLPGERVDLQLLGSSGRVVVSGRLLRCRIVDLSPLCHEAAIEMDESLGGPGAPEQSG